ncbi:MAG TPA: acetylglutamate kinase [Balneolales bacterium]|nr:acetylglutamate kinase [Balneolales bacterium]
MEPILVKIGGELVEDPQLLKLLKDWLHEQKEQSQPVVIVHGAGKQVDLLSQRLKVETVKHLGRRVTNQETLQIFIQAMAGSVNKKLVAELRSSGLSPVGITAADGNISTSIKRKPLQINGDEVDFGYVGDIQDVDPTLVKVMLQNNFIPVIGCLTWSDDDGLMNINADTLAMHLSVALNCNSLILLTKAGAVFDQQQKPISSLTASEFEKGLQQGWIKDGMIPKLETGFQAISGGVTEVTICNPDTLLNKTGTNLLNEEEIKHA